MSELERTLVFVKPDGVQRALIGEILSRFEKAGLKIVGAKLVWMDGSFSRRHYAEHVDKPFYNDMKKFITEGPVMAVVLEGRGAIGVTRKLIGSTKPQEALPGTIRGDFAHDLGDGRNVVHASANEADAKREVKLWFKPSELHSYRRADERHVIFH